MKMNRFIFVILLLIMVGVMAFPALASVEQEQDSMFATITSAGITIVAGSADSEEINVRIRANLTPTVNSGFYPKETVSLTYSAGLNTSYSSAMACLVPSFHVGKSVRASNYKT
ncbi:hypothetical protein KAR91_26170 [Candidatus Pacearchaeota archaeon]|nr:hypothetical protein [Candidatus Pacearchaeota archaeon]